MLIRLLGEISAGEDAESLVPVRGRVSSAVLAHLALADGRLVSTSRLIDAVWDEPSESARNAVQVAVSRLRGVFGAELITTSSAGYRLRSEIVSIDYFEVEHLISDARQSLPQGDTSAALSATQLALEMFAGEPLAGLASSACLIARQRGVALHEMATIVRTEALLASGEAAAAAALIRSITDSDHLNEPATLLLMRALASGGRGAEALDVYNAARVRLAEDLGVDPSAELTRAFADILNGETGTADSGWPAASSARLPALISLPRPVGPLMGREAELTDLAELFGDGHHLVTLVGPGGIGKTRLAVEVARARAASQRSAVFVDLSVAREPADVASALLRAVDANESSLAQVLSSHAPLLVLDNAEHLIDAVASLAAEVLAFDGVDVLVTSRTPLHIVGERVCVIDGLEHTGTDSAAVRLIADCAGLSEADVAAWGPDLAALASRLDGVPLAMELLAASLRWSTPGQVLDGFSPAILDEGDETRDRTPRHASVASALNWSIQQASKEAGRALAALSVMRGSFDEHAASAVIAGDSGLPSRQLLAELMDLSLIRRVREPRKIRFRLLEPIRLFASERLSSDASPEHAHAAHATYFLNELNQRHDTIDTSADPFDALMTDDQGNLIAAMQWAWINDRSLAMRCLGVLVYGWFRRNQFSDVQQWAELALQSSSGTDDDRIRIAIAWLCALMEMDQPEPQRVEELSELVATIERNATEDVLDDLWHERWVQTQIQGRRLEGDLDSALFWASKHRMTTIRNRRTAALTRASIFATLDRWDDVAAEVSSLMALGDFPSENDLSSDIFLLSSLGYVFVVQGELAKAEEMLERAMTLVTDTDMPAERTSVGVNLGWLALERGDFRAAIGQVVSAIEDPRGLAVSIVLVECMTIAGLALREFGGTRAARLLAAEVSRRRSEVAGMLDTFVGQHIESLVAQADDAGPRSDPTTPVPELIELIREAASELPADGAR